MCASLMSTVCCWRSFDGQPACGSTMRMWTSEHRLKPNSTSFWWHGSWQERALKTALKRGEWTAGGCEYRQEVFEQLRKGPSGVGFGWLAQARELGAQVALGTKPSAPQAISTRQRHRAGTGTQPSGSARDTANNRLREVEKRSDADGMPWQEAIEHDGHRATATGPQKPIGTEEPAATNHQFRAALSVASQKAMSDKCATLLAVRTQVQLGATDAAIELFHARNEPQWVDRGRRGTTHGAVP